MKAPTLKPIDLDAEAEAIRRLRDRGAKTIHEIGQRLLNVRTILTEDGKFLEWIKKEFDWSVAMAYRFIAVAERFKEPPQGVLASTLYEMATPAFPDQVRQEIIARATSGEAIGPKEAKRLRKLAEDAEKVEASAPSPHQAGRKSVADLDYFPTHPAATRMLVEHVLAGALGISPKKLGVVLDPGCGEGHITGVLEEYGIDAWGSDIHNYAKGRRLVPGWIGKRDFLDASADPESDRKVNWIITNAPFEDKWLPFAVKALQVARKGVALFAQTRVLAGVNRYRELYEPFKPLIAQIVERIPLLEERCEIDGDTMTEYMWVVVVKGRPLDRMLWIPPGSRAALTRADDKERFEAHPVRAYTGKFRSPGDAGEQAVANGGGNHENNLAGESPAKTLENSEAGEPKGGPASFVPKYLREEWEASHGKRN